MIKRFSFPLSYKADDATASVNEVVAFEDFSKVLSVAWVGSHSNNADIELRTKDGKDTIVDQLPIGFYQLGNGREEMVIDRTLSTQSLRVKVSFTAGAAIEGSLVFTCEK
jgi:hypothetical protein